MPGHSVAAPRNHLQLPGGRNVPIGNYTSQWLGNLYLNELDQWLRQEHGVTAYVRYCDDFCLFDDDKRRLRYLAGQIEEFLRERLRLALSKNDIFPVSQGVDFLGYRHFSDHILLRKSTATRMKRRLRRLPEALSAKRITPDQYRSTLASVSGWLRWANTHHLQLHLQIGKLREVIDGETGGIEQTVQRLCKGHLPLDGEKLKMEEIIDQEVFVTALRIKASKFDKKTSGSCLTIQFVLGGKKYVCFTGSTVLAEQARQYESELPFLATIRKIDKI